MIFARSQSARVSRVPDTISCKASFSRLNRHHKKPPPNKSQEIAALKNRNSACAQVTVPPFFCITRKRQVLMPKV